MFEEGFVPLSPVSFFKLQWDCPYLEEEKSLKQDKYKLPDTSDLCHEESFATLHMGWNEKGLHFVCHSHSPFQDAFYPDIARGDSLELFIDTRDVKQSGFNTKFCHHFFFLPQSVDGHKAEEMTHFRTDDAHDLCDPKELHVVSEMQNGGYQLKIFIPSHCLFGYDPKQFQRLGFTYRVNRYGKPSQHFSATTAEFPIEQQPSLWSSLQLIGAK
jgi:hypothetical protein